MPEKEKPPAMRVDVYFAKGGLKGGLFILKTVLFMENMK